MATEAMTFASLNPMVDDSSRIGPKSNTHASAPKTQACRCVSYPIMLITNSASPVWRDVNSNRPSKSETVPMRDSSKNTDAPGKASPVVASRTVPLILV